MIELENISDLVKMVRNGEIDESKLEIYLDNDCTGFWIKDQQISVSESHGYYDIEPLYKLLFPKAKVEWV